MPDDVAARPAWLEAEMQRQATRRSRGRTTPTDQRRAVADAATDAEHVERYWLAKANADQDTGGPAARLYDLEVRDGGAVYVPVDGRGPGMTHRPPTIVAKRARER
jgi:hypothetical protein